LYTWLVFIHIIGVLGFLFTHGVSTAMALRLQTERNPDRIRVVLQLSASSTGIFYVFTALLLLGGIWAGFEGGWWDQGWVGVSLGLFLANMVFMYAVASPYYKRIREVMTIQQTSGEAVAPAELDSLLRSRRPKLLLWVGALSIAFITYLMVQKPF
jgi:hypothetical protein